MPFPGPIAVARETESSDCSDLAQAGVGDGLSPPPGTVRSCSTGVRERKYNDRQNPEMPDFYLVPDVKMYSVGTST